HGHLDRKPANLALARVTNLALMCQADVETGSAHVDGDRVDETGLARQFDRAQRAGGRARQDRPYTVLPGRSGGHQSAIGLHDVEATAHPQRLYAVLESLDVAADDWHHVRIRDRGAHPFVLFEFRQHLRRQRDFGLAEFFTNELAQALL